MPTPEETIKINQMMKDFYFFLLDYSGKGIQGIYRGLKPAVFPYGKIRETFNSYGMNSVVTVERDVSYAFLDYETLEPLLFDVMTMLHKFAYRVDFFDCDQFASAMSVLMGLLYGINTCGSCWGEAYDKRTVQKIGGHFFNISISYNPVYRKFELWLCDPLNVGIVKIEKGQIITLNDWEYRNLNYADFR